MRSLFSYIILALFLVLSACKTVQQKTSEATPVTLDVTNSTSMNKDAVRVLVVIKDVKGGRNERQNFSILVKEIVKYGATFSSVQPKVGEIISLTAPNTVSFNKDDVILMDVLTPRMDKGEKPMTVRLGQP